MYKITYMGDGSTTEFSFNFPFYENTDIVITKNNTALSTGYSIVGTSAGLNADIPYTGGKVVFTSAPKSTDSITISRKIPLSRLVDYQPTEKINPTVLNQDQNHTLEILKDFDGNFEEIDEKYADIINTERIQTLINKINEFLRQINYLDTATSEIGGIPGIASNILSLNDQITNKLNKTLDNLTTSAKQTIVSTCMPDYDNQIVGENTAANTYITCQQDSFVVVWGADPYQEDYNVLIKTPVLQNIICVGKRYDDVSGNTQKTSFTFLCPKDYSFTCGAENGFEYRIIPLRGV